MANVSYLQVSKLVSLLSQPRVRPELYASIVGANRLAIGIGPMQADYIIDFSDEKLVLVGVDQALADVKLSSTIAPRSPTETFETVQRRGGRRSGRHWIELDGVRTDCISLKDKLAKALLGIEAKRPGMLDKLSNVQPRSKRIVARDPEALFQNPDLASKYAEPLTENWWFGTNNSAEETNRWLQRACECAGLKWGKDFRTDS